MVYLLRLMHRFPKSLLRDQAQNCRYVYERGRRLVLEEKGNTRAAIGKSSHYQSESVLRFKRLGMHGKNLENKELHTLFLCVCQVEDFFRATRLRVIKR